MSLKDESHAAVGAHGMWKATLRSAINTGKLDIPIATIKSDKECKFGKWLYGTSITAQQKNSAHYLNVLKLHAAFHEQAAKVAQLAISGNKAEADKMFEINGELARASSNLTQAMMEWRSEAE
jgi:hypothetical protein